MGLFLFISLVRNASFLIVKRAVSGNKSVISTNHCERTYCWWVLACAPHLWFVHLPNWHFSLHLPPLQRPGICAVDNLQRFIFGSLPTSSQERVIQESTFTFTFTLCTIYEVNGTARYLEKCSSLSISHTLTLYLSLPCTGPPINWSIEPSIHRSIHRSINRSIGQSID